MTIKVNGEQREIRDGTTVRDLIKELGLDGNPVAVEVNRAIVHRAAASDRPLNEGDIIEVVHFVGGG